MNLSYTADEERFRAGLRAWLEANPAGPEPERLDDWVAHGKAWERKLSRSGDISSASSRPTRSGVRASRSRAPARTWPRCARGLCWTAITSS